MVDTVDDVSFAPFMHRHNRSLEEPFALIVPGSEVETMLPAILREVGPNPRASLAVSPVGCLHPLGQSMPRRGDEVSRRLYQCNQAIRICSAALQYNHTLEG
jgi:hypothetical protein